MSPLSCALRGQLRSLFFQPSLVVYVRSVITRQGNVRDHIQRSDLANKFAEPNNLTFHLLVDRPRLNNLQLSVQPDDYLKNPIQQHDTDRNVGRSMRYLTDPQQPLSFELLPLTGF